MYFTLGWVHRGVLDGVSAHVQGRTLRYFQRGPRPTGTTLRLRWHRLNHFPYPNTTMSGRIGPPHIHNLGRQVFFLSFVNKPWCCSLFTVNGLLASTIPTQRMCTELGSGAK